MQYSIYQFQASQLSLLQNSIGACHASCMFSLRNDQNWGNYIWNWDGVLCTNALCVLVVCLATLIGSPIYLHIGTSIIWMLLQWNSHGNPRGSHAGKQSWLMLGLVAWCGLAVWRRKDAWRKLAGKLPDGSAPFVLQFSSFYFISWDICPTESGKVSNSCANS